MCFCPFNIAGQSVFLYMTKANTMAGAATNKMHPVSQ